MPKEIAAYIDKNGQTTSLYEEGRVVIYQRNLGQWQVLRAKSFSLGEVFNMKALREQMNDVIEFLGPCKTFVGLSVSGIPYFALEKSQCSVWEFTGNPVDFLDYILAKEEEESKAEIKPTAFVPPAPVETFNGCYRISIKEIQEKNLGVTSKQVLMPFIRQGKYYSLEVLCNHVPPWLENEILMQNLESRVETIGKNDIKLILQKKCCEN